MDPNENIKRQRELATKLAEADTGPGKIAAWTRELAELVIALDEWRTSGGFDPYVTDAPHRLVQALCQELIQAARNIEPDNDQLIESSDADDTFASLAEARRVLKLKVR